MPPPIVYAFVSSPVTSLYDFINAVARNLRDKSQYRLCQFRTYSRSNSSKAIEITKHGQPINLFLFYESVDGSGKIGSIAIYGLYLNDYYKAIKQAGSIFGLNVESVELDAGFDDFLDIYVNY